ncbi:MAG TPA: energy transducer TonB [Burkholderiales bacterium]|nr:energy transducer TonB [Burkholderiales bacterium]
MRRNRIPQYLALCAIAAVAGCATVESPPPAVPQPAAPPVQAVAPPTAAPAPVVRGPASNAATMDVYKKHVAQHIHAKNSRERADSLPPILKSVVVLNISIDRDGKPVHVAVMRSNGHKDVEQIAIRSVHRAGPLPAPSPELLGNRDTVSFVETWLFRPDGLYQVRSVAENQRLVVPSSSVAATKKGKK